MDNKTENRINRMNTVAQQAKLGSIIKGLSTEAQGIPTVVTYELKADDITGTGLSAQVGVSKAITTIISISVDSTGTFKPVVGYTLGGNKKTITLAGESGNQYQANDVVTLCYL